MRTTVSYRALSDPADRGLVTKFYQRAADYILHETGAPPDAGTTEAYFTGSDPGHDCRDDLREGLFLAQELSGISELAFDLPHPGAATVTLMVLAKEARSQGIGSAWINRLTQIATAKGAAFLCLSVLESNPRARRFWERSGFRYHATLAPHRCGARLHTRLALRRPLV